MGGESPTQGPRVGMAPPILVRGIEICSTRMASFFGIFTEIFVHWVGLVSQDDP